MDERQMNAVTKAETEKRMHGQEEEEWMKKGIRKRWER